MTYCDFTGKRIMVVGASSGIGQATCELLADLGAAVVLVSRNKEKLEEIKGRLPFNSRHMVIPYDSTDYDNSKKVFEAAVKDNGKLDGLVYSAGIAKPVPLRVISAKDYDSLFSVNYYGFLNMVQQYSRRKYNNGGSIVAISAVNKHYPQKCMTLYAATKAAIEASVRTLAIELSDLNIRINSVIPGAVNTPMASSVEEDALTRIVSRQLLGIQEPAEIANVIAFLLSDSASAITGRNIFADGGMLGQ